MITSEGKKFKILVVDDNAKNIQLLGNILREAGYQVGYATDGVKALHMLEKSPDYDLMLLDINMPIMDGFETCKQIRKNEQFNDMPIIFLTAYQDKSDIIKGFETGAQDYVTKPYNTKELLARVNTHLQLRLNVKLVKNYAEELEKINATKDKFFSIIAHDLKNPFMVILGSAELLLGNLHKFDLNRIEYFIRMIQTDTRHAHALLENLLEWSRSQTGTLEFRPTTLSLCNIVKKCIDIAKVQSEKKSIKIINKVSADQLVDADENMLQTIIRNLLSNAIKFTHDSGTVTVTSKADSDHLEVCVADTGVGIPKEDLDKLFRIDTKYVMPGTSEERGAGLGLILCKEFVDKHGGTIWVVSTKGKGSEFHFTVPVK